MGRPTRRRSGDAPSEAELVRRWAAAGPDNLGFATADGQPVQVHYPGRPGRGPGPDFRDAVVTVADGVPVAGDIEVHRVPAGFTAHGHQDDPAYNRVMLHVVGAGLGQQQTTLASGRMTPVVELPEGSTGATGPRLLPCARAVEGLGCESCRSVLHKAGLWRMQRKQAALAEAVDEHGPAQALYVAVATALGQKANAQAMTLLAGDLPLHRLCLEDESGVGADEAAMRRRLLHSAGFGASLFQPAPALPWVCGVRPAAHPVQRITALAALVFRLGGPALTDGAQALLDRALDGRPGDLVQALTIASTSGPSPCGRGRAVEVAVNALIPWGAALAARSCRTAEAHRLLQLADGLPIGERYGRVDHLTKALRDGRNRPLVRTALDQQGALALLAEWCGQGGCGRCPLS